MLCSRLMGDHVILSQPVATCRMPPKQVDVLPLAGAGPSRSRGGLIHSATPPSCTAQSELTSIYHTGPHAVTATVALRFDPLEGYTELSLTIKGVPRTLYHLLVLVPNDGDEQGASITSSVGSWGDSEMSERVEKLFSRGAGAMSMEPVHHGNIGQGNRLEHILMSNPDESTTILSCPPNSDATVLKETAEGTANRFVTCAVHDTPKLRPQGVLCTVFSDEEGYVESNVAVEGIRIDGPPGEGSSIVHRWLGIVEVGSEAIVALGVVTFAGSV
jgi:hypothetical protein